MGEEAAMRRRGRIIFLVIAAMFIVPMSGAWIWYMNLDQIGPPDGSTAKGELLNPPHPLGDFALPRIGASGAVTPETLRGRWTMVYVGGEDCDEQCRASLIAMRQSRLALGKDMDRVTRLYLLVDAAAAVDWGYFATEHPGMVLATLPASDPLRAMFVGDARIWLIDPLGNLMMRYPGGNQGRALLDDLKRLLRLSRVG